MDADKPILDFLAQPENLSLAYEISDYVEKLKEEYHISFWDTFNKKFHDRFTEAEIQNWRFVEIPRKSFRSQWKYFLIEPLQKPQGQPYVVLFLGQTDREGKYTLLRGLSWNNWKDVIEGWSHPSLEALHSRAVSLGISTKGKEWIRFKYYLHQLEGLEFMQEMIIEMDAAVDKVLCDFWNSFIELHTLMEEVNLAVSSQS